MSFTVETETLRGIEIEIIHDDDAYHMNPCEDDEDMPPMLIVSSHDVHNYGLNLDPLQLMTAEDTMANWQAILEAMDGTPDEFHQAVRDRAEEERHAFPYPDDYDSVLSEMLAEGFSSLTSNGVTRSELHVYAALYRIAGVPARVSSHHGHVKGDYMDTLVVHLPKWREKVGAPEYDLTSDDEELNGDRDMRGSAQHYANWAFGDVYGYKVHDPDNEDREDSCWGFICQYGSEGWDYLLTEAREAAAALADDRDAAMAAAIQDDRPDLYQLAA